MTRFGAELLELLDETMTNRVPYATQAWRRFAKDVYALTLTADLGPAGGELEQRILAVRRAAERLLAR